MWNYSYLLYPTPHLFGPFYGASRLEGDLQIWPYQTIVEVLHGQTSGFIWGSYQATKLYKSPKFPQGGEGGIGQLTV